MGATGTDIAAPNATDAALIAGGLTCLPHLIHFSHRSWQVIRQNLILSILVISTLVAAAIMGIFSLPVVVITREISEFVIIASGPRMLRP